MNHLRGLAVTTVRWTRFTLFALTLICWSVFQASGYAQKPATPAKESSAEAILLYRGAVPLQNKGNYDLAVEEWEEFLKKFPNDPLANRRDITAAFVTCNCSNTTRQLPRSKKFAPMNRRLISWKL